jgi:REP element-mobilizing transposase RayT
MARCIQPCLSPEMKARVSHGGSLGLGKRKERRPIAVKRPMHVTMHTSYRLTPYRRFMTQVLKEESRRSGVRIYEQSLNSNHLHLATLSASRRGFQRFLSVLSSRIAQHVTRSRRGEPQEKKFWDHIPFTRIVEWGIAFKRLLTYVIQNQQEALGLIAYTPRKKGKKKDSS